MASFDDAKSNLQVFAHYSNIAAQGYRELHEGQKVEVSKMAFPHRTPDHWLTHCLKKFDVTQGIREPQAGNIRAI